MMFLIITEDYPSINNKYTMSYVHTRNVNYLRKGLDFIVLSFSAKKDYTYEDVKVITHDTFKRKFHTTSFPIVLSHAPNIRHHFKFLKDNEKLFEKIIFVFHGHEVLRRKNYYPTPFEYNKKNVFGGVIDTLNDLYDVFKLKVIKSTITKMLGNNKLFIVFVSEWMKEEFLKNTKMDKHLIEDKSTIISNSIHNAFINNHFDFTCEKKADFVTIRPFDNPKYAIDVVVKLAKDNPNHTFHIYGNGNYFDYNEVPGNIKIFKEYINQNDIPNLLNHYRCAVMPTRLDSQGVMMCEIATYGMPMVTSDLFICKEMLHDFPNIKYINNDSSAKINLSDFLESIEVNEKKNLKFTLDNTVYKEIDIIKSLESELIN